MKIEKTDLSGVLLITPEIFEDERGYFYESFNKKKFEEITKSKFDATQDNQSYSHQGILRGIHFQTQPLAQAKLIQVLEGEIFDVAVDLRNDSNTYCKWVSINLSSSNHQQLFIPKGFGHAFLTISKTAKVMYKVDQNYSKDHEKVIRYDDPMLKINWPLDNIKLSTKDQNAEFISENVKYF